MIGWENYEEYMMMHADGELQPAEERELMEFVAAHPELNAELKAYSLTRLSPDESFVYTDKNSLLRTEPSKRVVAFSQWRRYAIAAGVALLISFSVYKYREVNNSTNSVVVTSSPATVAPKAVQPAIDTTTTVVHQPARVPATDVAVVAHPPKPAPVANHKQHNTVPVIKEEKQERDIAIVKDTLAPIRYVGTVDDPPQLVKIEAPANHVDTAAAVTALRIADVQDDNKIKRKSFIDRLPIDESNKHQLKNLFRFAKATYHGVSKAKQALDGGEITVRVEDNKLRISF